MSRQLINKDYDHMLVTEIAAQSDLFRSYAQAAASLIDSEYPTEEIWLGTLSTGPSGTATQIKIVVTSDPEQFIDEA